MAIRFLLEIDFDNFDVEDDMDAIYMDGGTRDNLVSAIWGAVVDDGDHFDVPVRYHGCTVKLSQPAGLRELAENGKET